MTQSSHLPHFRTWLASLEEEELATILRNRPDVLNPLPPSIAALATRLLLRTSIARALMNCTARQLAEIEDIARRGGELQEVEDLNPDITRQLKERGLAYGNVLIPPEVMPALPTGWSLLDQVQVSPEDIAELPDEERKVLETLSRSNGLGTTRDAAIDADPARPIPRLIAKQLLQRVDATTVRLPRAVHLALNGKPTAPIPVEGITESPAPDSKADDAGTAAGLSAVRGMQRVIDALGARPIELLKDKTVGVRQLTNLSKTLTIDEGELRRLIELGMSARLLSRGEPKNFEGNFLAPTELAQAWLDASLAEKWQVLLEAWTASPWTKEGRTLAHTNDRLPSFRDKVLQVYLRGAKPTFEESLRFHFPLFATHTSDETIAELRAEAEWIGAIALERPTSVLIDAPDAAARLTPDTVDYFLIQADMTVLVPGPLDPETHQRLEAVADLESPGLASVYRISDASLRRGLDRVVVHGAVRVHNRLGLLGQRVQFRHLLPDPLVLRHVRLRGRQFDAVVESLLRFHMYRREQAFVGSTEIRSLDDNYRPTYIGHRDRQQRMVDVIVFAGVETGEFTTEYPKDAARAVATMCVGVSTWFKLDGLLGPDELIARNLQMARALVGYRTP